MIVNRNKVYRHRLTGKDWIVDCHLAIAAAFGGDPRGVGTPVDFPSHFRTQIETAANLLPPKTAVQFACECVERVIAKWSAIRPSDRRPNEALVVAKLWLVGTIDPNLLELASRAAADAGIENDDTSILPEDDPVLYSGIHAADAASHAALAAHFAASISNSQDAISNLCNTVGFCARFATHAASNEATEMEWQKRRLAQMLVETDM